MRDLIKLTSTLVLLAGLCVAQEPAPQPPQDPAQTPPAQNGARPPVSALPSQSSEPKPYDKVITKDAKTKSGIFTVHQIKDKWYYEIPKSEQNKDFLWVTQFARAALGTDKGGQVLAQRVVRWERVNNRILLRDVKYDMVADPTLPIARAVAASNNDTILMSFNIEAFGKNDSAVIDVNRLYTTDIAEIGTRKGSPDSNRSYIERVTVMPQNVEVEATHTYAATPGAPGAAASPLPAALGGGTRGTSQSFVVHYSMVKLPEKPMMARLYDDRVGYFTVSQTDYGRDEQRVNRRTFITRWRLEKSDPTAEISDPVKPIVYYVDPATPKKYIAPIKRAVEAWQVAFEEAGFRKAIIAKEAPSPEEDPEWSVDDVRNTVIRWLPSETENAMGPHVSDPRSGEILNGSISVYQNVLNLVRSWYFLQASPLDARAQKLPFPDDLMADLVEYVVKHEVGHTLGFRHNMKASSMYPPEKMRDPEWLHKMGHVSTLMDYSRFNYVAQPEDKIPPKNLIPGIGPYDKFATMWGYKPIPNAKTPDEEKPTLDEWARRQDKTPWLRYAGDGADVDPGEQSEAVGDGDAVKSTALGLKNLERISNYLLTATTTEKGEPFDDLELMYGRLLGQWGLEMNHVVRIVGGVYVHNKHIGQDGVLYTPVEAKRQREAVKFLNENAFVTAPFFVKPEILRRIEPFGAFTRIANAQASVLRNVLTRNRLARLLDVQTIDGAKAYAPTEFLADVRTGVWKELQASGSVKIDAYRRNLQRSYIDLMDKALNTPPAPQSPLEAMLRGNRASATAIDEMRPLYRGELMTLSTTVKAAIPKAGDQVTRLHLQDMSNQIARALDPKFALPAAATASTQARVGVADEDATMNTCWPDYKH